MCEVNLETITSDAYKKMKNFEITYGLIESKFGPCIIATYKDKLCYIAFYDEGKGNSAIDTLKSEWPNALLKENNEVMQPFATTVFENPKQLSVFLKGTDFQVNVWKELIKLKTGVTSSYEEIAIALGKPSAIRAVANAISKNRVAYLIPCHRVIQKSGGIGKYRWGVQRKRDMLKYEDAPISFKN